MQRAPHVPQRLGLTGFVVCLLALLQGGCGEVPAPAPTPPRGGQQVYLLDRDELGAMLDAGQAGAMAWLPASMLERFDASDAQQRGAVLALVARTIIARLVLESDGTFAFDLRREVEPRVWKKVAATGRWSEAEGVVTATVADRTWEGTAPVEVPDTLIFRRRGPRVFIEVIGRTIPLRRFGP